MPVFQGPGANHFLPEPFPYLRLGLGQGPSPASALQCAGFLLSPSGAGCLGTATALVSSGASFICRMKISLHNSVLSTAVWNASAFRPLGLTRRAEAVTRHKAWCRAGPPGGGGGSSVIPSALGHLGPETPDSRETELPAFLRGGAGVEMLQPLEHRSCPPPRGGGLGGQPDATQASSALFFLMTPHLPTPPLPQLPVSWG